MGYSTDFMGRFSVEPPMSAEQIAFLNCFADECHSDPTDGPEGYCQWVPTEDGCGLQWDENDKFYNYVEWLEYLIKTFFAPKGFKVAGEVWWQGESVGDVGIITVADNIVTARRPQF